MTTPTHQIYLPLQFNQVLEIIKQLSATERQKLLLFLLGRQAQSDNDDAPLTHFASERTLTREWLTDEEDAAWQNL